MKLIIDCFGGDKSPAANIEGALLALETHQDLSLVLTGDEDTIKGELKRGDWLVRIILSRKGWFTPPFDTKESLKARLEKDFEITAFETEGAMVSFAARKVRR